MEAVMPCPQESPTLFPKLNHLNSVKIPLLSKFLQGQYVTLRPKLGGANILVISVILNSWVRCSTASAFAIPSGSFISGFPTKTHARRKSSLLAARRQPARSSLLTL